MAFFGQLADDYDQWFDFGSGKSVFRLDYSCATLFNNSSEDPDTRVYDRFAEQAGFTAMRFSGELLV